jgi:Tfp pilus assembly protein PilO
MAVVPYKDTVKRILDTPQKKTYTFLGATLILILVLLFGAIRPTLVTITKLRNEIKQREDINERLQSKINVIGDLQDDYSRLEEDLDMLEYYFPQNSDYSLFLANIEQIVKSFGYELERVSIQSHQGEDSADAEIVYQGMNKVNAAISVKGSEKDLPNLIENLEGLPFIPQITRISYSPATEGDSGQVEVRISFELYQKSAETVDL